MHCHSINRSASGLQMDTLVRSLLCKSVLNGTNNQHLCRHDSYPVSSGLACVVLSS